MATPTRFGSEFQVNTTDSSVESPAIAALPNGRFSVAWDAQGDIFFRVFSTAGTGVGNDIQADTTSGDEAAAAALPDGRTVVTWTQNSEIVGQLFNPDGTPATGEFSVNTTTINGQNNSTVTVLSNGRFVVAWQDASTGDLDVRARLFDVNGAALGNDFVVNATTAAFQSGPTITALPNGEFFAAWSDAGSTSGDIVGRRFDNDGTAFGNDFVLNNTTTGIQQAPQIAKLADGHILATWTDFNSTGSDIRARLLDFHGAGLQPDFVVNTSTTDNQQAQALAPLLDGRSVVVWEDPASQDIFGQVLNPDGTFSGGQFLVNIATAGVQNAPTVATLADGRFVVAWADSSPHQISAQIFDPREAAVNLPGSPLNDEFIGTNFNDTMGGGAGNDRLSGAGGNDTLNGGPGNDTLDGGPGDDTAVFSGNLASYTLQDLTLQGLGGKILVSGPDGADTLTGIEHLRFADGTVNLVDQGNPLFDTLFYLTHNPDVFHAGVNALNHFNTFGFHEGRDPDAFFDTSGYLAVNRDVAAAGVNPLDHFHQFGWKEGRDPGPNFDTKLYLLHNPDVAAAGADPLEDFLAHGIAEGRQAFQAIGTPVNGFDAEFYLFHNPDVAAAGVNPLQHFNTSGFHEGRNPNAVFDTAGYLSHYADVAAAGVNPLQHYEQFGFKEGRDPSAGFDTLGYLAANPDVAAAHVNPIDHFLTFGIYEGRAAVSDGLFH